MLLKNYHQTLIAVAKGIDGLNIYHLCKLYRAVVSKKLRHHGKHYMVNHMKNLNSIAERYSMYQAIEPITFLKSDGDGFPTEIWPFKPYLRDRDPRVVKITLSIFRSCELLRLPPNHDITTVLSPPNYDIAVVEDIIRYIPKFIKKLPKLRYKSLVYHYTVKNGPNGPALATSDKDLGAVRKDVEIYNALQCISNILEDYKFPPEDYPVPEDGIHSKLTQFSEKSGKTRTIAVIDYYSQRALYPLHNGLMSILRSMSSDGTFSHRSIGNYAKEATKNKSFIATSDMTAFTDLFPAVIQYHLLKHMVEDQALAEAWWTLLAKRTFMVGWSGEAIRYGSGQPMGAYGSWPLCTLAHHLIMHYCAFKHGIKHVWSQYRILGDDNVRVNEALTVAYERVLWQLGCHLNPYKGTFSRAGASNSSAEVAKRLYLNGIDITPLTPGIISDLSNPALINNALKELQESFNDQELPVHILSSVVKPHLQEKCWMMCTNPYNGILKPNILGYEDQTTMWVDFEDRDINRLLMLYRLKNLIDTSISIERGEDLWSRAVHLSVEPAQDLNRNGGDMELISVAQYAMQPCKAHIIEQQKAVARHLWNKIIDESTIENFEIQDTEYLPDPRNPFKDSKVVRNTHAALLVEKVYAFLQAGSDIGDFTVEVEDKYFMSSLIYLT